MNPIWRVAHEMSKSRSETQKRNQRRRTVAKERTKLAKEQQRQEYLDRDRRRYVLGEENQCKATVEHDEAGESSAEKFQRELCWCIEQLEVGLLNPKATKLQRQESEKILRTLKSSKAPMAKKRQVMHATFGDYRTKIQDERKKHAAAMKQRFIKPAGKSQEAEVGKFLRRASSVNKEDAEAILAQQNGDSEVKDAADVDAHHSNSCQGNVDDDENKAEDKSGVVEKQSVVNSASESIPADKDSKNTGNSDFKFDFDIKPDSESDEDSDIVSSQEEKQDVEKADEGKDGEGSKVNKDASQDSSSESKEAMSKRTDSCQKEASVENASLQSQMEGMCVKAAEN
ncbi:protein starmaker-like [Ptychodera flava]|uniref:protein starmaker-like n=1 Tax=Ptychodera flava TaxID=63121 RepID=UPI00396A2741